MMKKRRHRMSNYWAERQAKTQAAVSEKNVKQIEKQLQKYYLKTLDSVIGQFELTYLKLLSTISEDRLPTPADLYKLDSYWKMQGQLKQELEKLGNKQAALLSKRFTDTYLDVYEALAIPSQTAYSTISTETAQQMINNIWCADGKSWSNRIWTNTEDLATTLNEELIECVVGGKKTTELKQRLMQRFDVSYNRANSLVKTEIAHIQTQAAKQRYLDYGLQEVEIWADKDERRCEVCGKLHQKRYPIGANVPIPAHPNCRCCIIPVVED